MNNDFQIYTTLHYVHTHTHTHAVFLISIIFAEPSHPAASPLTFATTTSSSVSTCAYMYNVYTHVQYTYVRTYARTYVYVTCSTDHNQVNIVLYIESRDSLMHSVGDTSWPGATLIR